MNCMQMQLHRAVSQCTSCGERLQCTCKVKLANSATTIILITTTRDYDSETVYLSAVFN